MTTTRARRSTRVLGLMATLVVVGSCGSGTGTITIGSPGSVPSSAPVAPEDTAPGDQPAPAPPAGWVHEVDPSGAEYDRPEEWDVEQDADGTLIVFLDPATEEFRRNINLMLQDSGGSMTLDDFTELSLGQFDSIGDGELIEEGPTTFSGTDGHRSIWSGSFEGTPDLTFLSVWTIRDGDPWLFTYTAEPERFDESLPEVEQLLASIRLPE